MVVKGNAVMSQIDRKGLISFLVITFTLTFGIELVLILTGLRLSSFPSAFAGYAIAAVMWIPSLAALITAKFITGEGLAQANIRVGKIRPYIVTALLLPLSFAIIYTGSWVLGLAEPDWDLSQFLGMVSDMSGNDIPPLPSPGLAILGVFAATTFVTPFFNSVFGFGEELGWRGYLLPKLMPLGKKAAYILIGLIWAVWHLPLIAIGFTYPSSPLLGFILFAGLTTTFGVYLNEMTLAHESTILAGWIHGVFNSQKLGIWPMLFPTAHPLLGGYAGLVGIVVWLVLALITIKLVNAKQTYGQQAG